MGLSDTRRAAARQNYDALTAEAMLRLQFQVSFAEQALKGLMLVNGGAIVALYTVIGNSGAVSLDVGRLWAAFGCFVAGLVLTLLAYLGAFASQNFYYISSQLEAWNHLIATQSDKLGTHDHLTPYRQGYWAQIAGVGCASLGVLAFLIGAGFALAGVLPA